MLRTEPAGVRLAGFYRWAKTQADEEARALYPMVSAVCQDVGKGIVVAMKALDEPPRRDLQSRQVKVWNGIAAAFAGEGATSEDEVQVKKFAASNRQLIMRGASVSGKARKHLRAALADRVTTGFGVEHVKVESDVVILISTGHGKGTVASTIDFERPWRAAGHEHKVTWDGVVVMSGMSLCGWMGFSSQSMTRLDGEEDPMVGVDALVDYLKRFHSGADSWLP